MRVIEEIRQIKVILLVPGETEEEALLFYQQGNFVEVTDSFVKVDSFSQRKLLEKEEEDPKYKRCKASLELVEQHKEEKRKRGRPKKCQDPKEEAKVVDTTIGEEDHSAAGDTDQP